MKILLCLKALLLEMLSKLKVSKSLWSIRIPTKLLFLTKVNYNITIIICT